MRSITYILSYNPSKLNFFILLITSNLCQTFNGNINKKSCWKVSNLTASCKCYFVKIDVRKILTVVGGSFLMNFSVFNIKKAIPKRFP